MLSEADAYDLKFLVPALDDTIGWHLREAGEFARAEYLLLSELLRAGEAFIDVGANLGAICLPIARDHPDVSVVAVEANRPMANLLAANALTNRLTNVDVHQAAAGRAPGIVKFPLVPLNAVGNHGAVGFDLTDRPMRSVRMLTIDQLATRRLSAIKIDVEGHELEVLAGATETLERLRPTLLIEANHHEPAMAVAGMLRPLGYDLYWFFAPFASRPTSRVAVEDWTRGDSNILALPSGRPLPPTWVLPPVAAEGTPRPKLASAYPYLARFGLT